MPMPFSLTRTTLLESLAVAAPYHRLNDFSKLNIASVWAVLMATWGHLELPLWTRSGNPHRAILRVMSHAHEEAIREAYRAINARDVGAARALAEKLTDPAVEIRSRFAGVEGRVYRGHGAIEQWFADTAETWETIEQTPERFIDAGSDRTIAVVRFKARGKTSGVELDEQFAVTFTFRDGRIVTIDSHPSLGAALEAAGLSE